MLYAKKIIREIYLGISYPHIFFRYENLFVYDDVEERVKDGGQLAEKNFFHGNLMETIKYISMPCLPELITDGLTRPTSTSFFPFFS